MIDLLTVTVVHHLHLLMHGLLILSYEVIVSAHHSEVLLRGRRERELLRSS